MNCIFIFHYINNGIVLLGSCVILLCAHVLIEVLLQFMLVDVQLHVCLLLLIVLVFITEIAEYTQ